MSAFSFGLEVAAGSGIAFTGAGDAPATTSHIFSGPEAFDVVVGLPGSSLIASDMLRSVPSVSLATGDAVGLGRISYSVAAGATPGDVVVPFLLAGETEILDAADQPMTFGAVPGSIGIAASGAVPEPASLAVFGLAAAPIALAAARRRSA